ncbi:PREDICTED: LOB domain-containing protein 12-like isoform X1 [Nicotiana attenuata]|uniref:LOB domain-containing protein 12-like isoform X1 n=1 Tax=Nicotiana attenuata TaxID=49451 RepID=UPI000904602C|nr:PREDICTED: LOB domain-containing protein 12-like isoform X1 [Nicotiana attenuata]XP_019229582.1 PREDICTED: LOB domain-containing protein 12-like isoform X1 [Nicotiana attenuata]
MAIPATLNQYYNSLNKSEIKMGATGNSPCASCKLLRRRCAKDCIFAPYFPSDDPHKFAIVHKVFGASNISKMLQQEVPVNKRADAVSSLVYEANARMRDPVYGCVGAISYLQNQVSHLQMQLAIAQADILSSTNVISNSMNKIMYYSLKIRFINFSGEDGDLVSQPSM